MNKIKALVLVEPGHTEIRDIDMPVPGAVLLQEYPNVLGHEVGATILQPGSGVPATFQPGMNVTLSPYQNCGKTMGVRQPGAMTGFIAVTWEKLHISNTLSLRELALIEPFPVGFRAAARGRSGCLYRIR
ncbi:MAG: alcohol dehydrogenase catalytic domain-containing protein [Rudanella sp.]|nr:alcohol dehydrogenase catalytic domain-containing protein [Rudanella sp.]